MQNSKASSKDSSARGLNPQRRTSQRNDKPLVIVKMERKYELNTSIDLAPCASFFILFGSLLTEVVLAQVDLAEDRALRLHPFSSLPGPVLLALLGAFVLHAEGLGEILKLA